MTQSITELLAQIRGGRALAMASEKLTEVIRAVRETNKPGEVSLILSVKPDPTDETVVHISPKVKCKTPDYPLSAAIFFVDEDDKLHREDPKQLRMELERKAERERMMEASGVANLEKVGRGPQRD